MDAGIGCGSGRGQFQHDAFVGKSDPRMTNSQRLAQVREHLLGWLDQQPQDDSVAVDGSPITSESVLIVDGFYCGRRFNAGTYRATWFIEEDELKIHDESGKLLCVVGGTELDAIAPSAALTPGQAAEDRPAGREIIALPNLGQDAGRQDDADQIRRAA